MSLTIVDYVLAMFDHVSPPCFLTTSLHRFVKMVPSLTMCDCFCLTMFDHVWSLLTMLDHVFNHFCPNVIQTSSSIRPNLIPNLVQTWSKKRPEVPKWSQTWSQNGPNMVPTWPQTWSEDSPIMVPKVVPKRYIVQTFSMPKHAKKTSNKNVQKRGHVKRLSEKCPNTCPNNVQKLSERCLKNAQQSCCRGFWVLECCDMFALCLKKHSPSFETFLDRF